MEFTLKCEQIYLANIVFEKKCLFSVISLENNRNKVNLLTSQGKSPNLTQLISNLSFFVCIYVQFAKKMRFNSIDFSIVSDI